MAVLKISETAGQSARKPRRERTHNEIYDLLERNKRDILSALSIAEEAKCMAEDAVHRTDLHAGVVQRVETKLSDLVAVMGIDVENGAGGRARTGLIGTMHRLEAMVETKFKLWDGWTNRVIGAGLVALPLLAAIWWLVQDKLTLVLKH